MSPFSEVLLTLEDARQKAWSERSPKHVAGVNRGHRGSSSQIGTLPNSHSQPIYVPGKYLVSSFSCSFPPANIVAMHYSLRVVFPIRKKTRFMASATVCSPQG